MEVRIKKENQTSINLGSYIFSTIRKINQENKIKKKHKKNRISNILWTITEDYKADLSDIMINLSDDDFELRYFALVYTGAYKYLQAKDLEEYIIKLFKKDIAEIYLSIFEICLEEFTFTKLIKERKGLTYIRQAFIKAYVRVFENEEDIEMTPPMGLKLIYYQDYLAIPFENSDWGKALIRSIKKISKINDTGDFIRHLNYIFDEFIDTGNNINRLFDEKKNKQVDITKIEKHINKNNKVLNLKGKDVFIFKEEVLDAEFNPNKIERKFSKGYQKAQAKKIRELKTKKDQKIYETIRMYFGDSVLEGDEISKLEKALCKDFHQNCKLHLTEGKFTEYKNDYQLKVLEEQKLANISAFKKNKDLYERQIKKLSEKIISIISPEEVGRLDKSFSGKLSSQNIWRATKLNDYRIFSKKIPHIIEDLSVDILVDGSGSMFERQDKIAIQAYIIAEALSLAGLACRLCSFMSFSDYTIIRKYRDYGDEREKNKKIFEYVGTGMNRDGLAYRYLISQIKSNQASRRLLIVLSDGKPNDTKLMNKHSVGPLRKEYQGRLAVKDAAKEIHKGRIANISILGVFNGYEEDLPDQIEIFGKDFAYIKKIERFSDLVGRFLDKQLSDFR